MATTPFKLPDLSNFAGNVKAHAQMQPEGTDFGDKERSAKFAIGIHEVTADVLETVEQEGKAPYHFIPITTPDGKTAKVFISTHKQKDNSLDAWGLQRLFKCFGYDIPQYALTATDEMNQSTGQGTTVLDYIRIFCRGRATIQSYYSGPHAKYIEQGVFRLADKDDNEAPFYDESGKPINFLTEDQVAAYAKTKGIEKLASNFTRQKFIEPQVRPEIPPELEPYYQALLAAVPGTGVAEPVVEAPVVKQKPMFLAGKRV